MFIVKELFASLQKQLSLYGPMLDTRSIFSDNKQFFIVDSITTDVSHSPLCPGANHPPSITFTSFCLLICCHENFYHTYIFKYLKFFPNLYCQSLLLLKLLRADCVTTAVKKVNLSESKLKKMEKIK